jgi:hypothetical protein
MFDGTHSELSIGVYFDQIDGTFNEQFSKDCIHHSGERFDAIATLVSSYSSYIAISIQNALLI